MDALTEEEARAKWCPFSRVASDWDGTSARPAHTGWNRRDRESFGHREHIGGENHCMASRCMAWRWHEAANRPLTNNGHPPKYGRCGLAA